MFHSDGSTAKYYKSGFPNYLTYNIQPRLRKVDWNNGARLLHVIPPGLAPWDKQGFYDVMHDGLSASAIVGPVYKTRIQKARILGCATTRLQIVGDFGVVKSGEEDFVDWQRLIGEPVHNDTGEGCQVIRWNNLAAPLTEILADSEGQALLQDLYKGIEGDFPVGGFWALYKDPNMQHLDRVAEVLYKKMGSEATFAGFNAYEADQLSPVTREYVDFMGRVSVSGQATTLFETIPTWSSVS